MAYTAGQFDLVYSDEGIPFFKKADSHIKENILRYITFGDIDSGGDIYPSW